MSKKALHSIIALVIGLTFLRGLIYGLLIPFDSAPDENFYFRQIKAKQLQFAQASEEEKQLVAAKLEVTWRMLRYPRSKRNLAIEEFAHASMPLPPPSSQIYYPLVAGLLQLFSLDSLCTEIYALRELSILWGTLVVLMAFLITREVFPDNRFLLIGVPLLIAFIPQFSATNGAINNDKLAEVFSACVFWFIVKIFKDQRLLWWGTGCLVCSVLALLSKRTAVFLIPVLLLVVFVYYWKASLGIRMHLLLLALVCGGVWGGNFLAGRLHEMNTFVNHYLIWMPPHKLKTLFVQNFFSIESLKFYVKFFTVLYWSFWGIFGNMSIHLHHGWYVLATLWHLLAIGGLGKLIIRARTKKPIFLERWQIKVLYLFGASIVCIVVIMLYRSIFSRAGDEPILDQGRRFFIGIVPISVLTILGIEQLVPPRYHRLTGALGIIGLIVLDTVSLSNYVLLNFHGLSLF